MQQFRTLGGTGNLFHVLVPGVFLVLNLAACMYWLPFLNIDQRSELEKLLGNPVLGVTVVLAFGYLAGVILRIFRSEFPDRLSAIFLQRTDSAARNPKASAAGYAHNRFPYTPWMQEISHRLPPDAQKFYDNVWKNYDSKDFLNFAKLLVVSEDERAAGEIHAAESLCRYISGMFYAVFVATASCLFVVVAQLFGDESSCDVVPITLVAVYFVTIVGILRNYRFMRIKEVQTVFYASFKNRHLF